jgi:UDP-N-acetylglucosamine--N-acetylmuramyl-(pentapeptide) pyrophosphoryl-undecaprenol N-acetylglucosamine transferase
VLDALHGKVDPVLWVGSETGMEKRLITHAGLPYSAIPAAGLHGVSMRSLPGNLIQLLRGIRASKSILFSFRPDVLLFTGGYVAVPMAIAGRRLPSVLYVPDIEPGLALKTLARFASHIALTAEESRHFFPSATPVSVTGYPVRTELLRVTRSRARKQLGLNTSLPVLLVFGGSKGARSINQSVLDCLPELLSQAQVLHITGSTDWPNASSIGNELPGNLKTRYHSYPYLYEEMGAALASADLALCRAGASTLGELPQFGLPAVLVPYPYAWRYQKVNADYLAARGAAVVLNDGELGRKLLAVVSDLLQNSQRLTEMKEAMQSLANNDAAMSIAKIVLDSAEKRNHA